MGLFGRKKEAAAPERPAQTEGPEILVLGSGCAKCNALEEAVQAALADLGMNTAVGHVKDFAQIAAYGVMSTPALVVGGKVVSCGRVLTKAEAAELIQKATG